MIFHKRPISNSTKEIAEFLAIVHALAYLNNQGSNTAIYSGSETAMLWVRDKSLRTTLHKNANNEQIFNLI